jgi:hypothetical protein
MKTLDTDMGDLVSQALRDVGVTLHLEESVEGFETKDSRVIGVKTDGVIDYLANPIGGLGPLVLLVGVGVGASLAGGLVGVLRTFLQTSISQGTMLDLRAQLFDRLLRQSVGFFTSRRSGDLLSRMSNDVGGIQDVVSETVFGLVSDVVTVGTTLALMLALDWRLTLAAVILMPIVLIPSRYVGKATFAVGAGHALNGQPIVDLVLAIGPRCVEGLDRPRRVSDLLHRCGKRSHISRCVQSQQRLAAAEVRLNLTGAGFPQRFVDVVLAAWAGHALDAHPDTCYAFSCSHLVPLSSNKSCAEWVSSVRARTAGVGALRCGWEIHAFSVVITGLRPSS